MVLFVQEMPREARINNKIRRAILQQRPCLPDFVLSYEEYYQFLVTHVFLQCMRGNVTALLNSLRLLHLQCDVRTVDGIITSILVIQSQTWNHVWQMFFCTDHTFTHHARKSVLARRYPTLIKIIGTFWVREIIDERHYTWNTNLLWVVNIICSVRVTDIV